MSNNRISGLWPEFVNLLLWLCPNISWKGCFPTHSWVHTFYQWYSSTCYWCQISAPFFCMVFMFLRKLLLLHILTSLLGLIMIWADNFYPSFKSLYLKSWQKRQLRSKNFFLWRKTRTKISCLCITKDPSESDYLIFIFPLLKISVEFIGVTLVNKMIGFKYTILWYIICILHCVFTTIISQISFHHHLFDSLYPLLPPSFPSCNHHTFVCICEFVGFFPLICSFVAFCFICHMS